MAYNHGDHQQRPQPYSYGSQHNNEPPNYAIPLKPIPQATSTAVPSHGTYDPVSTTSFPDPNIARLESEDAKTKRRIRILRAISRIIATILSLATFIPLATTLVKFLETRNKIQIVDGQQRTAWALGGSITWYTYLYTGVATVSLILNSAILVSYCRGVRSANTVAVVEGWWAHFQTAVEVLVWVASVAIYRYGKEPDIEGKFRDLWGWTCSPTAQAIQDQITNVDFDTYCNIQTTAFYTGVLNVLASILTGCIYLYAVLRMRSKSKLRKATFRPEAAMGPLR